MKHEPPPIGPDGTGGPEDFKRALRAICADFNANVEIANKVLNAIEKNVKAYRRLTFVNMVMFTIFSTVLFGLFVVQVLYR